MMQTGMAFIDVETTGLDPLEHELLEVAVILTQPDLTIEAQFDSKVYPRHLDTALPEALELVGYSGEEWQDAPLVHEVLETLQSLLEGRMLAGHNVAFDEAFLRAAWDEYGRRPQMDYHRLDTASLAWPLWSLGLIEGVSLHQVCQYLGIEQPRAHRALDDARASLEAARQLRRAMVFGGSPEGVEYDIISRLRREIGWPEGSRWPAVACRLSEHYERLLETARRAPGAEALAMVEEAIRQRGEQERRAKEARLEASSERGRVLQLEGQLERLRAEQATTEARVEALVGELQELYEDRATLET